MEDEFELCTVKEFHEAMKKVSDDGHSLEMTK